MLTLGTCEFIKKKFGLGYNLILSASNQFPEEFLSIKKELNEKITSIIPLSKKSQSTEDNIVYILPFTSQNLFTTLFEELEEFQKKYNFTMSLEMNTLEDAFVNIGMDEENLMKAFEEGKELTNILAENCQIKMERDPACLKRCKNYYKNFDFNYLKLILK